MKLGNILNESAAKIAGQIIENPKLYRKMEPYMDKYWKVSYKNDPGAPEVVKAEKAAIQAVKKITGSSNNAEEIFDVLNDLM
jgi:hypothetical protein